MGIVWFFLWFVVHISGNDYINAAEKAKEKQGDCQVPLVANSHQPNPCGSSGTDIALDPQNFAKASQWRRNILEEDQKSSQSNHGDSQRTAMALPSMLEARQGKSTILPQLRGMVGIGTRQVVPNFTQTAGQLVALDAMARPRWFTAEHLEIFQGAKFIGQETQSCQKQRKRQRQRTVGDGAITIPKYEYGASSSLSVSNVTDWNICSGTSRDNWCSSRSGTHQRHQACVPRDGNHAGRAEGDCRANRSQLQQDDHPGIAQSNSKSGPCSKERARIGRGKRSPQTTMDGTSRRVIGQLEATNDFIRRAAGSVRGADCPGQDECRSCSCNHPKAQCEGRRQVPSRSGAVGTSHRRALCRAGSGRNSSSQQTARAVSRMCNAIGRQGAGDSNCQEFRFRARRRETRCKTTPFYLARTLCSWYYACAHGYIGNFGSHYCVHNQWYWSVTHGSAWVCPRNSKREPNYGKRVIFADAKAYAQPMEECAASRCNTPYDCLFQAHHPMCSTHSVNMELDFVSPCQAWTTACKLRGEVLLDSDEEKETNGKQQDTVRNGVQSHVDDLWCVDHGFASSSKAVDCPQEDSVIQCKPNPDIVEDFDSIIPFRLREQGGHTFQGRTTPPPNWEENQTLRSASSNGAVFRDDEGELRVTLRTWIAAVRGTMISTFRDVTIRAQLMGDVEIKVRRTWADQIQPTDRVTLTTVRPSPRIGNAGQRPMHVLIEINRPAGSSQVPILIAHREIDADGPSVRVIWIPILVNSPIGMTTLHGICSPPCSADQMLVPQPGRVRRWLATGQQRIVTAGLFLPIWWDLRLRPPAPTAADYDNDQPALFQLHAEIYPAVLREQDASAVTMPEPQRNEVEVENHFPHDDSFSIDVSTWQQLQHECLAEADLNDHSWIIISHGLLQRHYDTRRVEVSSFDKPTIVNALRDAWTDLPFAATIHMVWPNPEQGRYMHAIVEFRTTTPPPADGYPLLRRVFDQATGIPIVEAAYHFLEHSYYSLILQAQLHDQCLPWGRAECRVRSNGVPLQTGFPYQLRNGALLDFFIDAPTMQHEDDSSFMQQPRGGEPEVPDDSQDPEYLIAHTFHMSTSYKLVQLELNPSQTLIEQLTPIWKPPQQESIVALHEVQDPPHELQMSAENTLLVEMSQDALRKAHIDDCMTLADIQLNDPRTRLQGIKIRKVLWARSRMTRTQVLSLFSAESLCNADEIRCSVWRNKVYWPDTDRAIRQFANGDFIHILIRSVQALNVQDMYHELCSHETADSQRYLYRRSPTPESQIPTETLETEEQREGSRSRSRSLSLLQLSSRKTHAAIQTNQLTIDHAESKPHVLDRWCAQSLYDHNGSAVGQVHGPQSLTNPKVLELDKMIEKPCWVRVNCQQVLTLRDQLLAFEVGPVDPSIAKVVKWHDATLQEFLRTPAWTDEPALSYQFYTDGSSFRQALPDGNKVRTGASAVVLIVTTPAGARYGGSMTFAIGHEPTAPQTEIAAVTIALLWIKTLAQLHPHHSHPFNATIGFDCMTAGMAAEGYWKIIANQDPQTVNRALTQWIQQQYGDSAVQWMHISSHQGHAWNEAADALAWAAVHQWIDATDFDPVRDLLYPSTTDTSTASWLWFLEASLQGSPQVPPTDGTHFLINIAAPLASTANPDLQPLAVRRQQDAYKGPRQDFEFALRCASANVLTLFSKEDSRGAYISARQEALLRQIGTQQVHVVGVQETRSSADGHASAEGFHILSSPASNKGVGGVQVWIAQSWSFPKFSFEVAVQHLRILHCTTQRMIVALDHPGLRLLIVTAHAPACESPEATRRFWTATSAAIPKGYQTWPVIHLLDANARIGSSVSTSIGSFGSEAENDAGAEFHDWLLQHDYVVPQSFEKFHRGSTKHGYILEDVVLAWITSC